MTKNADEHKKEGVETHRLAEEMLPVYSIAIMQKRYFNDEEMIHVYCHKERKRNDELKVHFKGFEEEQNLSLMGFLELEKYNEDKIEEYKKERWIEFFGNQPYTQTPEKILKQADRIVSRIDWTKEEREMYDERTRYIQAYLGHLASVEKEKKDAISQALTEGKAEGIEHGKKMMIISLIKDGLLSKEEGAKRLSISVIELDEYMSAEE